MKHILIFLLLSLSFFAFAEEVQPFALSKLDSDKSEALAHFSAALLSKTNSKDFFDHMYLAIEKDPKSSGLIKILFSALDSNSSQKEEIINRLLELAEKNPDAITLNAILGMQLLDQGKHEAGLKLIQNALHAYCKNPEEYQDPVNPEKQETFRSAQFAAGIYLYVIAEDECWKDGERFLDMMEDYPEISEKLFFLQYKIIFYRAGKEKAPDTVSFPESLFRKPPRERYADKYEAALSEFTEALEEQPIVPGVDDFSPIRQYLIEEGKIDEASVLATDDLLTQPFSPNALSTLARFYSEINDPENAIRARKTQFTVAKQLDPHDVLLFAMTLIQIGDLENAVEPMDICIKKGLNDDKVLLTAISLNMDLKNYGKVREYLQEIKSPNLKLNISVELETAEGNLETAYAQALQLLAIPEDGESEKSRKWDLLVAGDVMTKLGKIDEINKHMTAWLEKHPDDVEILNYLGYTLADANLELDRAEKMLEKVIEKKPDVSAYLDSMAWLLYRKKEFARALEYMEKALNDPKMAKDPTLNDHAGDIFAALGRMDEARKHWQIAADALKAQKSPEQEKILKKIEGSNAK